MSARSKARKRALDILYAAEVQRRPALDVLAASEDPDPGQQLTTVHHPLTRELVTGVVAHQTELDEVISAHAQGWTLNRMPQVDRWVLRLASFELLYAPERTDTAVIINEAVNLARQLSTDDSGAFVHGVLGALAKTRE